MGFCEDIGRIIYVGKNREEINLLSVVKKIKKNKGGGGIRKQKKLEIIVIFTGGAIILQFHCTYFI